MCKQKLRHVAFVLKDCKQKRRKKKIKANKQSQINIFEDTFSIFIQLFTYFEMTEGTVIDHINQITGPGTIQIPVKAVKDKQKGMRTVILV